MEVGQGPNWGCSAKEKKKKLPCLSMEVKAGLRIDLRKGKLKQQK
jgi:hypothetical protein